jgi:endonuclease III
MINRSRKIKLLHYLDDQFGGRAIELNYSNPLELLVATILSAQCTDQRVNQVTSTLFRKYRTARDYAEAKVSTFEKEIRSTGFYKAKTMNIIRCCQELVEKHHGKVPDTMEELTTLPGVWRKTANVILGNVFGQPAIVVDTHVTRVSQRIGLTRSEDADQIEQDLARILPKKRWTEVSHQLLLHGRYVCKAKAPDCFRCGLFKICTWNDRDKFRLRGTINPAGDSHSLFPLSRTKKNKGKV